MPASENVMMPTTLDLAESLPRIILNECEVLVGFPVGFHRTMRIFHLLPVLYLSIATISCTGPGDVVDIGEPISVATQVPGEISVEVLPETAATPIVEQRLPDKPTIVHYSVEVKTGPSHQYQTVRQVQQHANLTPIGRDDSGDWLEVELAGGMTGWIEVRVSSISEDHLNALPIVEVTPEIVGQSNTALGTDHLPVKTPSDSVQPQIETDGSFSNLAEHVDGRFVLTRSDDIVTASIETARSPVQYWARQEPQVLFVIPPDFRPTMDVVRTVVGTAVLADASPDPENKLPRPFRMQVNTDGSVRYVNDHYVNDLGLIAYTVDMRWGTSSVANDHVILELLDSTWFGYPLLSHDPPPEDIVTFDEFGHVTGIRLGGTSRAETDRIISGPIPSEIGQLSNLEFLDLSSNELDGPIPPELGQLSRLKMLSLNNNGMLGLETAGGLTGPIPPELGQLSQLQYLFLGENRLSGSIPPELGQLTNLIRLNLRGNQLSGIPPELGQLRQLKSLNLKANCLTGQIPPELGQLNNLEYLVLGFNNLSGPVPEQLASMRRLEYFGLVRNQITEDTIDAWAQLHNFHLEDFGAGSPYCQDGFYREESP